MSTPLTDTRQAGGSTSGKILNTDGSETQISVGRDGQVLRATNHFDKSTGIGDSVTRHPDGTIVRVHTTGGADTGSQSRTVVTTHPDGRVERETTTSERLADGTLVMRATGADGVTETTTSVEQPNGSTSVSRVRNGEEVYSSVRTVEPDGTITDVVRSPEGTGRTVNQKTEDTETTTITFQRADGVVEMTTYVRNADGTEDTTTTVDGRVTLVDHFNRFTLERRTSRNSGPEEVVTTASGVEKDPDGTEREIVVTTGPGSLRREESIGPGENHRLIVTDGEQIIEESRTTVRADGSREQFEFKDNVTTQIDSRTVDGRLETVVRRNDGTDVTHVVSPDGSIRTTTVRPDGSTENQMFAPDGSGTITRQAADATVTEEQVGPAPSPTSPLEDAPVPIGDAPAPDADAPAPAPADDTPAAPPDDMDDDVLGDLAVTRDVDAAMATADPAPAPDAFDNVVGADALDNAALGVVDAGFVDNGLVTAADVSPDMVADVTAPDVLVTADDASDLGAASDDALPDVFSVSGDDLDDPVLGP